MDNRRKRWYDFLGLVPKRVARWLLYLCLVPLLLAIVLGVYAWRAGNYDMAQVVAPLQSSTVFDAKGAVIGTLSANDRVNITEADLPKHLVEAFIAREDADFYDHGGIVYSSMVRSLMRNISTMSFAQGGSTITMQLARNAFELNAKSIDRKMLEIAIARRIESKYDKSTILAAYLNRIYFGMQCYGIAQAADYYFGKSVRDLDLSESAMLAGIVRGPSIYNPVKSPDAAVSVRNETLDRMAECEYLTPQQADAAKKQPLVVTVSKEKQALSYPILWVANALDGFEDLANADTSNIHVLTSFDLEVQRELELLTEAEIRKLEASPVWKNLPKRVDVKAEGCLQAAVLCVESKTGNVLAVLGGRCPIDGRDRWRAKKQPGRLFLPLVNLAAAEAGRNIISNNALTTGRSVGYAKVMDLAKAGGIEEDLPRSDKLYEGLFNVSLLKMARVCLILNQKGRELSLSSIKQIATSSNHLLYERPKPGIKEVFNREAAYVVSTFPPFKEDRSRKIVTLDIMLPDYEGRFHAIQGTTKSVFLWVGFDEPNEEYWKTKGVAAAIDALGESIADQVYRQMTSTPKPPAP